VLSVSDDPGSRSISSLVLASIAAQPLVKDGLTAIELVAMMATRVKRRWPVKLSQAS